jgi:protease-4
VAFAALLERRRSRRWGIFFKFLIFVYLTFLILINLPVDWEGKAIMGTRHTALVTVDGLIASSAEASAENVIAGVRAAFDDERTAGIILEINSPGGSPVQSGEIFDEISRLRDLHPDIPVYAVAIDVCASGGYYVAAAAKQIYANRASIIGSIGVRADSFGFVGAMEKLGIERRLYVAGNDKAFLDPFSPPRPAEVAHLQGMLDDIHHQFIAAVKKGRGDRLSDSPELFTGLVWTGDQSLELGLIDGLGSTQYVAEQVIGVADIADFTRRPKVFDRIFDGIESALLGADRRGLRFH